MSRLIPVVIFLSLLNQVSGQQYLTLTTEVVPKPDYDAITGYQKAYLTVLYAKVIDLSDELINGREHIPYYFKCIVKPLLFAEKKRSGSLLFNGRKYNNLTLEYDTYLDQLIYSDSTKYIMDQQFKIDLNKDPVGEFTLFFKDDSMKFRYFKSDNSGSFNLSEGFYEVVYDGKTKCIIKHQSFIAEKDGLTEYRYTPSEYFRPGKDFTKVKSSRAFIKLFGKDSDVIRKYMRTNRVHFRRAPKQEIAAVLRYYDTLEMSDK